MNDGDPREHKHWDKWCAGIHGGSMRGYYCILDGSGTHCGDECKVTDKCIMQMFSNDYLNIFLDKDDLPFKILLALAKKNGRYFDDDEEDDNDFDRLHRDDYWDDYQSSMDEWV